MLSVGFPVTDAEVGTSFAVTSGHDAANTDWSAFKSIPTLLVLMGGKALPVIVEGLLKKAAWREDTPVSNGDWQ